MSGMTSSQMALRDPDIRLMLRVRDQDDAASFTQLVQLYQHRLVSILHHLVGHRDEAEDLAQEVFLRVYRTRKKYRPRAKFSTWLFTIAHNLALNCRRDRRLRAMQSLSPQDSGPLPAGHLPPAVPTREQAPTQELARQELAAVIQSALQQLNERQRLAVMLNKFEDMGYAEIAEVMNLSVMAIRSLLSRARSRLRELLQDYILMESGIVPIVDRDEGDAHEA